ncbi:hypothetical protein LCGC14_2436080, partial [marine sediment metagenome]
MINKKFSYADWTDQLFTDIDADDFRGDIIRATFKQNLYVGEKGYRNV